MVSILKFLVFLVNGGLLRIKISLGKRSGLSNDGVDIVVAGFVGLTSDDLVDVTGSAAVNVIFKGNVACITRKVLLAEVERH